MKNIFLILILLLGTLSSSKNNETVLTSPNGQIVVNETSTVSV